MCECQNNCCSEQGDLLPIIRNAAAASLSAICQRPNALSILRNGGWEQTLRNEIAFTLEESGAFFALTEAVLGHIDRIDVLGRCRQCDEDRFGARFAIETKTNFAGQPSQLSDAINKLARLSDQNVSTYVIYALTSLRASIDSDLAKFHRLPGVPPYKQFTTESPWHERAVDWVHANLSVKHIASEGVANATNVQRPLTGHATAQVAVWVARTKFIHFQRQCQLQWMNQEGETTTQIWDSPGPRPSQKGKLRPPKWSFQDAVLAP